MNQSVKSHAREVAFNKLSRRNQIVDAILAAIPGNLLDELESLGDPRVAGFRGGDELMDNIILDVDSYKKCHYKISKADGVSQIFSYIESRSVGKEIVMFGLQIFIKKYLSRPITQQMINSAEEFFNTHINGVEFPRADWEYVLSEYNGYLPVVIQAVPEGTVLPSSNVLVTVTCLDDQVAWLASYIETCLLRAVWYPTTIATRDRERRELFKRYLIETSDSDICSTMAFMLHDFGARGVSSKESAEIGGAAHFANGFMGSDTISGIIAARKYYNEQMAAYSVDATEHSIMTLRGRDGELDVTRQCIEQFADAGRIVSMVLDGYNIDDAVNVSIRSLADLIRSKKIKLVVRPDSGVASEVCPRLAGYLEDIFGVTTNSKGYKVGNNWAILQGDGLSELPDFEVILDAMKAKGYSSEVMVFGMGGGMLQHVTRDTYNFAQKTCAVKRDGSWFDVFKDPATKNTGFSKTSKKGVLGLFQHIQSGEYRTERVNEPGDVLSGPYRSVLRTVYDCGIVSNMDSLAKVRARATSV